jgi:hypothetical protein
VARSARSLFVGRGRGEIFLWIVSLLLAAVAVARAIQTGKGWAPAIILVVMAAGYTFMPWLKAMRIEREREPNGTLTIDDWGVTRVAGAVREAVAWDDLVWVRIYTNSAGPAVEDVYFALGGADGKGCLVPQELAVHANLLAVLQERLPGLDNTQVIRAMASADDAYFTIWARPADPRSPTPPGAPN